MSRKPNKAAIGAFVVGALALAIAAVLVFGGGRYFTRHYTFITYFDGSVKGLSVGSPVMFRGVKIGSVTNIGIILDPVGHGLKIPVVFTLEPVKLQGTPAEMRRDPESIQGAVKQYGLRTQLQSVSILTGQLMVALDFFPDKPARLVGLNKDYPEIPSVPTSLEEFQRKIENLPLMQMVQNLNSTLAGIDRLAKSIETKDTMQSIQATLQEVRTLVRHVDARVNPLMESLTKSALAAQATIDETRETVAVARGSLQEFVASTKEPLQAAQAALKQSEQTLRSYSDEPGLMTELNKTLRELSATARSLRQLSDYLERHPESLLRGKAKGE